MRRAIRSHWSQLLSNILFGVLVLVVVAAACLYTGLRLYGVSFYEVTSESMEPALKKSDVVASKSVQPHEVSAGDILVFRRLNFKEPVVHRVTKLNSSPDVHSVTKDKQGKVLSDVWTYSPRTIYTKGDNNPEEDSATVSDGDLIGRKLFVVPFPFNLLVTGVSKSALFVVGAGCISLYILWEVTDAAVAARKRRNNPTAPDGTVTPEPQLT